MRRRINLTIDTKVVARAKTVARRQGTSVSRLVEQGLQNLTNERERQTGSFADLWVGKLKLAPRNPADRRRERLWRKYGLARDANSD